MIKYLFLILAMFSSSVYSEKVMILDSIKKNILDNRRFISVNEPNIKARFFAKDYKADIFSGGIDNSLGLNEYTVNFIYRYDSLQRVRMTKSNMVDGYFLIFFKVNRLDEEDSETLKYINFFYDNIFGVNLSENDLSEINLKIKENRLADQVFNNNNGSFGLKRLKSDNEFEYFKLYLFK